MQWVLGMSVALLAYIYIGYPVLIWALSRLRGRPVRKGPGDAGVAVLIAAHNEAEALPRKLANLLEHPTNEPIREIWIGLDGCTDGTGEAVREQIRISNIQYSISNVQGEAGEVGERSEVRGQGSDGQPATCNLQPPTPSPSTCNLQPEPVVHILEYDQRRGKAAVLNDLMAWATQPVLVMMDARQRVEAGAISRLLENLADPQVGVVSGALVYESAEQAAQKGAETYWGYEKFIRRCESRYWAVPGATGALYAIRRDLCAPIPDNTLVDDVLIPIRAVRKGSRCLFEPQARVFDRPSMDHGREMLRKRRTLAGIWQLGRLEPWLFHPVANPIWFQWVSHKFLRLLTPFLLLAAWGSAGILLQGGSGRAGSGAGLLFWGLLAGLGASAVAYGLGRRVPSRLLGVAGAFFGVNWALLQAARDAWTGGFEPRWEKSTATPDA